MEIRIQTYSNETLQQFKSDVIAALDAKQFGNWYYHVFGIGEDTICIPMEIDGMPAVITFLLEIKNNAMILTPAQLKGDNSIPLSIYLNCMCNIIRSFLSLFINRINTISITKQL